MVNAAELSCAAIADALREGRFYSSTGPEIYEYGVRNVRAGDPAAQAASAGNPASQRASAASSEAREVYVECSPAQRIYFLTYPGRGYSRRNPDGGTMTSATYSLKGDEKYVRVEVVDGAGKMAWTNPVLSFAAPAP